MQSRSVVRSSLRRVRSEECFLNLTNLVLWGLHLSAQFLLKLTS